LLQLHYNHKEVIARLDRALDIDPEYKKALFAKGLSLIALERVPRLQTLLDEIIQIDPQYYQAYRGLALLSSGKYSKARKVCEMAPELDQKVVASDDEIYVLILAKKSAEAVGLLLNK
jgi:tetratricopeptide (TPR) repeat protein